MELYDLINRDIHCTCGRTHRCDIQSVRIGKGVLSELPCLTDAENILLLSDRNTYSVCGDLVSSLLGKRIENSLCYDTVSTLLVPNEDSVSKAQSLITDSTDLVLGIGSGVINDISKYVSFGKGIPCGIIATAPSMDGFASSGAAMIFGGMKVTYTTHAPDIIIGDTDVLATAPMHMIAAGYADIIGKFSALNDWQLSRLVNGEYLCPFVYDLVMEKTRRTVALSEALCKKEEQALSSLMENLVLIGVCLTLLSTTRPGSGSEHHLSHYFEITGLINNRPYFLHGTDVGYSTLVTAAMRERICGLSEPGFMPIAKEQRLSEYSRIYKGISGDVEALQNESGRYDVDMTDIYREKWSEIAEILSECPRASELSDMLTSVGFDLPAFEALYGKECIGDAMLWAKDLKDRYSVLWLYYDLFGGEEK